MRIWTINLSSLDTKRLVALWRETLLCKKGIELLPQKYAYQNHPQSKIFQNTSYPLGFVNTYLSLIKQEADRRGYNFDSSKIDPSLILKEGTIPVPLDQVQWEYKHLSHKLQTPKLYEGTNALFHIEQTPWPFEPNRVFYED
jgi:hypothetical protein